MKKFATYDEQIEILKSKKLVIDDDQELKEMLSDYGYYNIINGYAYIFQDKNKKHYIKGASVKDIKFLHSFDKSLRNLIYKYAMVFESRFKSLVSYVFSKYHGEDHNKYLVRECFDKDVNKNKDIQKLIEICNGIINESQNPNSYKFKKYILHYVKKHNHVPLWVLIRAMTLGATVKFYVNMRLKEKTEIANIFGVSPSNLSNMAKMLADFRNTVAHDEPIFSKEVSGNNLSYSLKVYDFLKIQKNQKGNPVNGTKDFLALVIIFKYLLKPMEFSQFWEKFVKYKEILNNNVNSNFIALIDKNMSLNCNWKDLANFNPYEQAKN